MEKKELREKMPMIAALIDDLRGAFGAALVHGAIREGIAGNLTFYASENGHEIGSRETSAKRMVGFDRLGRSFAYDVPPDVTLHVEHELWKRARDVADLRTFTQPSEIRNMTTGG